MSVPDGSVPKKYATHLVIKACEDSYDEYCDDCSGFVKAVLGKLGMPAVANHFPGQGMANDIVEGLESPPWTKIDSSVLASRMSEDPSRVVIAGCKDDPNGHVVVIVPGSLNRGKYPTAYWGSLDQPEKSAKYQTINWAWEVGGEQIDSLTYAYAPIRAARGGASGSW
jgi:hypothetical protein